MRHIGATGFSAEAKPKRRPPRDCSRSAQGATASMKIAYLITRAEPIGGAQIHVRDLAVAVRNLGHQPTVITGGSGSFVDSLRAQGVPVIVLRHLAVPIRPLQDLRALGEIQAALRKTVPDVL